jgi:hypothetical protein
LISFGTGLSFARLAPQAELRPQVSQLINLALEFENRFVRHFHEPRKRRATPDALIDAAFHLGEHISTRGTRHFFLPSDIRRATMPPNLTHELLTEEGATSMPKAGIWVRVDRHNLVPIKGLPAVRDFLLITGKCASSCWALIFRRAVKSSNSSERLRRDGGAAEADFAD